MPVWLIATLVGGVGFLLWKRAQASTSTAPSTLTLTPLNAGKPAPFQVALGGTVNIQLPVDPTGTVTYDGATPQNAADAFGQVSDTTTGNVDTIVLTAKKQGTYPFLTNISTLDPISGSYQQTGQLSWLVQVV